jgi:hypothetical protein
MALTVSRPPAPPRFFETWDAYLASWGGGEVSFCRAIVENNSATYSRIVTEQDEQLAKLKKDHCDSPDLELALLEHNKNSETTIARAAFPWITPVIGSGCLGVSEGPDAVALEGVPDELAAAADSWGVLPDGSVVSAVVRSFAAGLIKAKLGEAPRPAPTEVPTDGARVDRQLACLLTLCASLLSRLYFETCALAGVTLLPPSAPVALGQKGVPLSSIAGQVVEDVIAPLEGYLGELVRLAENATADDLRFVSTFGHQVLADLRQEQPRVRGTDVRLMAEIAWHFLAAGTAHYPGWSDLLVLLGFGFNSPDRQAHRPHLVDLEAARVRLAHELEATTNASWRMRCASRAGELGEGPIAREALYDSIADLLLAQAHLSKETKGKQTAFPPAVAFVTSFDLELEMALLNRRQPFRMVVPFYVRRSDGSSGASGFVWLYTDVIPGPASPQPDDLAALFKPQEWALLVSHPTEAPTLHDLPSIVHLAGCPLISGPDLLEATGAWADRLRARLGEKAGESLTRKVRVAGTVLLDEHTALQQWAAEFGSPGDTPDPSHRLGLPERFVRGMPTKGDARFWFLLGVQLHDDAVRQRAAALIAAADLREGLSPTSSEALHRRAGVVINRRSVASEREVFMWQGLDVVETSYQTATGALAHAALHVLHPEQRRVNGQPCKIGAPQ